MTPPAGSRLVACLPDVPELAHAGALPAGVQLLLVPPAPAPVPDLSAADLIVPVRRLLPTLDDLLARPGARLRVIQTLSAGVDHLVGRVPERITVCNARGIYDAPLAEWVVGAILAMERGLIRARDAQRDGAWSSFEPPELSGRRVVILGLGSIGTAIMDRLRPFGVDVVGIARSGRPGVHGIEDLDELLPAADIVVDILPLTGATRGLLDARRLGLLPDGALLVNAGRGRTVETEPLVRELASGRLRAVLDVTDPEPLPAGHPLWSLPNVLISPHVAGDSPATAVRAFALVGDQIRRFAAGQPLLNVVPRYLLE
jgi:phosphoglycerate dehydrogenase-like enzyme